MAQTLHYFMHLPQALSCLTLYIHQLDAAAWIEKRAFAQKPSSPLVVHNHHRHNNVDDRIPPMTTTVRFDNIIQLKIGAQRWTSEGSIQSNSDGLTYASFLVLCLKLEYYMDDTSFPESEDNI
ncbi:hypothetical protein BDB00DRAFT_876391 [Zychaea mexicana]|uniref:uncharacterized protein n=1 Tax=Zychaea mexicana TaxID=64656 RepID=UPI0022FF2007|nr:uncharacterized protein BDB00DRAFT_876391 [Zychaea mexicana]KAI9489405.1 hypothetical protein BDB00DRAFT_876391 [Zychaea mexicana]